MFRKNLRLTCSTIMTVSLIATTLTGCATTQQGTNTPAAKNAPAQQTMHDPYAINKIYLSSAESAYKSNPKDAYIAARYAKALRENNNLNRARTVIEPFLKAKNIPTLVPTENAAQLLEVGKFAQAESAARKATAIDNKNFRAYHMLGIALDAQQKHEDAEKAFRKSLEIWQGDRIPVMNNLALNLAAQGYTDQALDLLYQAQKLDSGRKEVERNIRIIRTLNEPAEYNLEGYKPPAVKKEPTKKEDVKKVDIQKEDIKKQPTEKAPADTAKKQDQEKPIN